MPTYQYACTACDHRFEAVQAFSDDALTVCPNCDGKLRKVFSSVGIVFKGSGFYRTDSRSGAVNGKSESDSGKSDSGKSESSGSGTSDSGKSGSSGSSGSSDSGKSGSSDSGKSGSSDSSKSSSTSATAGSGKAAGS